jgi:alkylhydroperoxidase/carboxymuconolactone decarboxylase family protein YurZ
MPENAMSRDRLREKGKEIASRLGLDGTPSPVPGLDDLIAEVVHGGVWGRPNLALVDRAICTLAVLSVLQRLAPLKPMVGTALGLGLSPRNIAEVFVQVGLYAGFVTTEPSLAVAMEVFSARGLALAPEVARTDTDQMLDSKGREVMVQLHGERAQGGYAAAGNAITGALYPMAIRYGYGELWSRPGLDRRQRMLCALAGFTAMGLDSQLKKFAQSALNVGLSREEVIEAVIQTAPYSGFPRALNGLAILSDVFQGGAR